MKLLRGKSIVAGLAALMWISGCSNSPKAESKENIGDKKALEARANNLLNEQAAKHPAAWEFQTRELLNTEEIPVSSSMGPMLRVALLFSSNRDKSKDAEAQVRLKKMFKDKELFKLPAGVTYQVIGEKEGFTKIRLVSDREGEEYWTLSFYVTDYGKPFEVTAK